jgi:hypothetical protein
MPSFASGSTQTVLFTPAAVAADANSAGVDINGYTGDAMVVLTGVKTAGTNPTLAVKLQHAADTDIVTSVTPGSNTGNGTFTQVYGGADSVAESITITFSSATAFAVSGGTTGAMAAGTVGTLYSTPQVEFLVTAGSAAFVNNDTCIIVTTARTYADVGDGAFTGLTTTGSVQRLAINLDKLGRYLRLNFDIGGTVGPSYIVGCGLYGIV